MSELNKAEVAAAIKECLKSSDSGVDANRLVAVTVAKGGKASVVAEKMTALKASGEIEKVNGRYVLAKK